VSYVVLARKWRPQRFEDLVGQDHVAQTLGNAIRTGRVAHAFLFTGVRGVGKTTSARILAKALNCLGDPETTPHGTDPGPTVTPCLKCAACLEIAAGSDVDVWEIDGASYNGVDEVRKLQDSLPYRPQRDRFKIYVVDEVHMLSQSAWNAFLKTLEEPPPHVKFIFATTEVHKVPVTILSRVQRFDFKLIAAQAIAGRLRHVLSAESIEADDAAVSLIAREAAGSMRDAMSLLDQVIAWAGDKLVGEEVARVLGVASHRVLLELATALVRGDAARCLTLVMELVDQGHDVPHVARDFLRLLRDLVVAKVAPDPTTLLDLPSEEAARVIELAHGATSDDLVRLHQGFSQGYDDVVRSGQPRAALEMLLVRLARRPPLLPIDDLLGRLHALERRLSGAGPSRQGEAAAKRGASAVAPRAPVALVEASAVLPSPAPSEPARAPEPSARPAPPSAPARRPSAKVAAALSEDALAAWRTIVERVSAERIELGAFLMRGAPLQVAPGHIVLGFGRDEPFVGEVEQSLSIVERLASDQFATATTVRLEKGLDPAGLPATLASLDTEEAERQRRAALAKVKSHPRVVEAVEVLGARVKDLKLAGR
jgi:DNA polymerase-3 subunit gamma/tau